MATLPRQVTAWSFGVLVAIGCAGGKDSDDGLASVGVGNVEGGDDWATGPNSNPDGEDWMNVDTGESESGSGSGVDDGGGTDNGSTTSDSTSGPAGDGASDATDPATATFTSGGESTGGPAANPFAGDYAGTADGSCSIIGNVDAEWTITVHADGTFDGMVDVSTLGNFDFNGTVSEDGEVVTSDGACGFLGTIEPDGTGSGDFDCEAGCSGTWSGEAV